MATIGAIADYRYQSKKRQIKKNVTLVEKVTFRENYD